MSSITRGARDTVNKTQTSLVKSTIYTDVKFNLSLFPFRFCGVLFFVFLKKHNVISIYTLQGYFEVQIFMIQKLFRNDKWTQASCVTTVTTGLQVGQVKALARHSRWIRKEREWMTTSEEVDYYIWALNRAASKYPGTKKVFETCIFLHFLAKETKFIGRENIFPGNGPKRSPHRSS